MRTQTLRLILPIAVLMLIATLMVLAPMLITHISAFMQPNVLWWGM